MRNLINKLLPKGSRRRFYAAKLMRKIGILRPEAIKYYEYVTALERAQIPLYPEPFKEDIKFSIIIPAYNTPDKYLQPLIKSILFQTYRNWQLIMVNASDDESSRRISRLAETDERIKVVNVKNKGISANTNAGIEHAKGEYIIFADHDDLLDHQALNEVRKAIAANPEAGLIYTDEDKVSEDGKQFSAPHFKPDWSPDLMNCVNYITHLVAVKKSIVDKVGPLDSEKDGAQDYDFLLRVIDSGTAIVHVPKVLYHWRKADNSTAQSFDFKPEAAQAGVSSLREHLERQGVKGAVVENREKRPGFYKVIYKPAEEITIIIAPFASPRILKQYVERFVTRAPFAETRTRLILPSSFKLDSALKKYTDPIEIVHIASQSEAGYIKASLEKATENVLIINKLIMPKTGRWLNDLSGVISVNRIAAAAPIIVNDTNAVSDSGYVYEGEDLTKLFKGMSFTREATFFGNPEWCREVNGLTGSIALLRKSDFSQFIGKHEGIKNLADMIKQFSIQKAKSGKDICIWSNVIFNDLTITAPRQNTEPREKFNNSLVSYGDNFHIVSDEEAITNRLALVPVEDENYE